MVAWLLMMLSSLLVMSDLVSDISAIMRANISYILAHASIIPSSLVVVPPLAKSVGAATSVGAAMGVAALFGPW